MLYSISMLFYIKFQLYTYLSIYCMHTLLKCHMDFENPDFRLKQTAQATYKPVSWVENELCMRDYFSNQR